MSDIFDTSEISVEEEDVNANKVYGILSYIGFLFIIPLLAVKDSRFAKFHANQGLVVFLAQVIINAASSAVCALLSAIHLGAMAAILGPLLSLVSLALSVIGIINAAQGKAKELPVIGKFHILDSENKQE
ncbi:MAG: zinc ribbon domain-containing protein [Bacteroides sp.]|nr:zinc ribbon domain-containing protein [Bacteroides sp.]MCM1549588.1 hypothetical protein [Clostridium sp.]